MKTTKYITAVAALLSMAACQSEEMRPGGFQSDPDAVRIAANVGEMDTRSNPTGNNTTFFNAGDKISLRTEDQSAVVYTLDADGTTWAPEDPAQYLKWNKDTHTFTAYYPETIDDTNLTVEADQRTLENLQKSDLMSFSRKCTKGTGGTLTLTMERRTALIAISKDFTWNNQYGADYSAKEVKVHTVDNTITAYAEDASFFYALVPPATADDDATFLTITVGTETTNEDLTIKGIPELVAGTKYTYTLTLGKDKAGIGTVNVSDWTTGDVIDNGQASDDYVMFVTVGGTYSYHIYTLAGLQEVNKILTAPDVTAAMLRADITLYDNFILPAPTGDQTSNWTAIGTQSMPFNGTLYGNGKTITGLVIDNPNTAYQGLIGCLGGSVYNLTLVGCTVKGNGRAGGIAGRISSGRVSECTVKATEEYPVVIESKDSYSGGLVAEAIRVAISNCSLECEANASISIKGLDYSSYVGGIAGSHELEGTMSQCDVTNSGGTITLEGGNNVGGLVGMNEGSSISDCNVDGVSAKGLAYVGGFAGENNNTASITGTNTVKNSYIEGWENFTEITVGNDASVSVTDGGNNSIKTVPKQTYY